MSTTNGLALIAAFYLPGVYIYHMFERRIMDRENEIVTGVVRGVRVSTVHRRWSIYAYWATAQISQFAYLGPLIFAYLVVAENVDDEGVKLVAYMAVFMSVIGLLGTVAHAAAGYVRCASALRQAEAG